jgi:membrane protein YdbS with pleckstrin-like domain
MPNIFVSDPKEKEAQKEEVTTKEKDKATPNTDIEYKNSHSKLSSFSFYPGDIDFESRSNDEKVVLFLRQHFIVNVKWIFVAIVLFFVPSIANMFNVFSSLPSGFGLVISMAWYLITMAYALENFLNWYFNVYIVTNERVVDVDFNNLIYKRVSDATLSNIQDVTYNMGGVIRTFLNYGDVFIQTASEVSEFDFLAVPEPDKVVRIINDLVPEVKQK